MRVRDGRARRRRACRSRGRVLLLASIGFAVAGRMSRSAHRIDHRHRPAARGPDDATDLTLAAVDARRTGGDHRDRHGRSKHTCSGSCIVRFRRKHRGPPHRPNLTARKGDRSHLRGQRPRRRSRGRPSDHQDEDSDDHDDHDDSTRTGRTTDAHSCRQKTRTRSPRSWSRAQGRGTCTVPRRDCRGSDRTV